MTIGLVYWILMLLWFIFGTRPYFVGRTSPINWSIAGGDFILFLLMFLLGWHDFGPPIHG